MNLDLALHHAIRTAKFGAVGDTFTLQVSGQGDWNRSDFAPSSDWLKQTLAQSEFNITDANVTLITQNPIGFAYGSRYAFWFQVDDEFSDTGTITDVLGNLTGRLAPYFDNYTASVTNSNVTPLTVNSGGGKGGIKPGGSGGTTAPGAVKKTWYDQIASDLKVPVAALAIIGFSVFLYIGNRK